MAGGGQETTDDRGFRPQRRRNMTEKGLEYNLELKEKPVKRKDLEFCRKVNNITSRHDPSEITGEISALTSDLETIIEAYDEVILLLRDPVEIYDIEQRKTDLRNLWHSVHATVQTCLLKSSDTKSVTSRHSSRTSRLSKSSSAALSQTLVEFKAKRAALEEKMKYEAAIAEQEKRLKELRLQQELEELKAKETVYERALEDEEEFEDVHELPMLSSERQYVMSTFLQCDENKTPVEKTKTNKQNTVANPSGTPTEEFKFTTNIPPPEEFQSTTTHPSYGHPSTSQFKYPTYSSVLHVDQRHSQPATSYGHPSASQFKFPAYSSVPHVDQRHSQPATSYGHPSASQFKFPAYSSVPHVDQRHSHPTTSYGHPSASQFKFPAYSSVPHVDQRHSHPTTSYGHPSASQFKFTYEATPRTYAMTHTTNSKERLVTLATPESFQPSHTKESSKVLHGSATSNSSKPALEEKSPRTSSQDGNMKMNDQRETLKEDIDIGATFSCAQHDLPKTNDNSTSNPTTQLPPSDAVQSMEETLIKVSQLHRIPQAKPEIFRGYERDRTRYFLWENSFNALIDSVPITNQQKLHLLYQHLDGQAKKVVEQLQYMISDPDLAYHHARRILKDRFGNTAVIGTEFERKLLSWPKIGPYDAASLEEFGDFLRQVEIASKHIESLKVFNFSSQMLPLVEKLPTWFKRKWSEKVMRLQNAKGKDTFPSFKEFVDEICYQAQRMNIPQLLGSTATIKESRKVQEITRQVSRWVRKPPSPSAATALASSSAIRTESKPIRSYSKECIPTSNSSSRAEPTPLQLHSKEHSEPQNQRSRSTYCFYHNMNSHSTHEYEQLNKLSFQERKELLRTRKVCFNCLTSDKHVAKNCSQPKLECKICQGKHSTVLHDPSKHDKDEQSLPKSDSANNACSQVCGKFQPTRSCARIVLLQIFHSERPELRIPTYAVLDDQSSDVFITNSLLDELNAQYEDVTLQINTIVGKDSVRTRKVNGLQVQDIERLHKPIKIQRAYTQDQIPADHSNIATPEVAIQWQHLNCIANQLHYSPNIEIGMLIGRNVPTAFQPIQVIYGKENEPWAERYKFGWTIIGPVCLDNPRPDESCEDNKTTVNKISVVTEARETDRILEGVPHFTSTRKPVENIATLSQSKDVTTPQQIKDMMQLDYIEVHHGRSIRGTETVESIEDQRFNSTLEEGIHVNDKGNWEMPLPFKTDEVKLPDNRSQCIKRLLSLKTKLLKKEQVRKDYTQFMQKIFDRGHATRVPETELKTAPGKVWYLPHFEVYHPKKARPSQSSV